MDLGLDTRIVLLAAGVMFLWALVLGVQKYLQILASPDDHAHPYTDIAHRAALLYSFAYLLIATFVELGDWSTPVNLVAVGIMSVYFFGAVGSYMMHGLQKDTDNQFRKPVPTWVHIWMVTLIAGEIGAFAVLLTGFIRAQF